MKIRRRYDNTFLRKAARERILREIDALALSERDHSESEYIHHCLCGAPAMINDIWCEACFPDHLLMATVKDR
jgi:hypothetical protein